MLEHREFSLIFSKNPEKIESLLEELINNKDPRFVLYFINYLKNQAKDNPQKAISFFNIYLKTYDKTNPDLLFFYLDFLLNYSPSNLTIEIVENYIQNEEDLDKIHIITQKIISQISNHQFISDVLKSFYSKIKGFEFKEIYLKSIIKNLKNFQKILELENFLTFLYEEIKNYWIVENLIEIYSLKEEYEKLLNIFISIVTAKEFLKAWSESLGIIDKTLEKLIAKEELIIKIIPHLHNINMILDKSPFNIYKIYNGILEYLDSLEQNQKEEFFKAFYNFLSLSIAKDLLPENQISNVITKAIIKQKNSELLEKIKEFVNGKTSVLQKIIASLSTFKDLLPILIDFIINNYQIIGNEILEMYLNNLTLDEWVKIHTVSPQFFIGPSIFAKLSLQSKDNFITSVVISKKFEKIEELLNSEKLVHLINIEEIENLSDLAKILVKLFLEDYTYIFYNIGEVINYPALVWYIYKKLKPKLSKQILHRIFMGIFLFYMNEEEIDTEILENFKRELTEITESV